MILKNLECKTVVTVIILYNNLQYFPQSPRNYLHNHIFMNVKLYSKISPQIKVVV